MFHQVTETLCISVPLNEKEKNRTSLKLTEYHTAWDGVHNLTMGLPHLYPLPLTTTLVCSSWRCQAWSYLRAFALVIPSIWTALPPGISQAFSQRSPSQWFSPPTIWNHNSSLSFSHILLCFICSISFITTYFIVCLLFLSDCKLL